MWSQKKIDSPSLLGGELVVFLVVTLFLGLALGISSDAQLKASLSTGIFDRLVIAQNSPDTSPEGFPRNISDVYKGFWNATAVATSSLQLNDSDASIPELLQWWRFKKLSGNVILQLANHVTNATDFDTVTGDIIFRDGIYTTDRHFSYDVQGLYFRREGIAILACNPKTSTSRSGFGGLGRVEDLQWELPVHNATAAKLLADPNLLAQPVNSTACYLKIALRWDRVGDLDSSSSSNSSAPVRRKVGLGQPVLEIVGIGTSYECGSLNLTGASLVYAVLARQAVHFALAISVVTFAEVMLTIKQMRQLADSQAAAARISLLTIGQQTIMDMYIGLLQITVGVMFDDAFNAFAFASFLKFVLFAGFESRFMYYVWRSRRPQQPPNAASWTEMRRDLLSLYAKFYASFLLGLLFMYWLDGVLFLFFLVVYSFWIPQIVCNITRGGRYALQPKYIVGMTLCRSLIPAYYYLCPANWLKTEPHLGYGLFLLAYVWLQAVVLLLQDRYGPLFFVPKKFLPPKYNYHRLFSGERECVICMSHVEKNSPSSAIMVTPCDHVFHFECLMQWMNFKLECPTCRRPLPNP